VVGINTAIIALAQGLGFSVPATTARWVVGELAEHGRVRRLSLGIVAAAVDLPRRTVRDLDLLSDQAVAVAEVVPGGAADQAGMRTGDFIVTAAGRLIGGTDDLHRVLAALPAGSEVTLEVVRANRLLELPVVPTM
jgi:S1-C subfamily serine protease